MTDGKIVLTPLEPGRDAEFAEVLAEYRAAGEMHVYGEHDAIAWQGGYTPFYEHRMKMKGGGYPAPDIVPTDTYFIEADGRILGELNIRRRLSPSLVTRGGHIGYKVRPSERNKGIATAALKRGLEKLREMGIEQALVTCLDSNAASARVIEKCGGIRIADTRTEHGVERRYWVATHVRSL